MELNFGENIRRLRRSRDLTQEALADALGVSAQSVSKWECAYGYPDITQLPAIANYFGVTVDALLNNDQTGKEKARQTFDARVNKFDEAGEEKIAFVLDYFRRYPDELHYAYVLCTNLSAHITRVCPENREKYYPLLRQTAEKLIQYGRYRDEIATCMINACPEAELDEWLRYAAYSAKSTRRNRLIERYAVLGEIEKGRLAVSLSNLEAIAIQLDRRYSDRTGPGKKGGYHRAILNTVASFGREGETPDGWLAFAGYKQLVYAACLFGDGQQEAGKEEFLAAMAKLRRYFALTEEYLDTGSPLFGGLRIDRGWRFAMDEEGERHKLFGTVHLAMFGEPDTLLSLLTNPRWAWFDSARNEDYYCAAVAWLEGLAENKG